MREAPPAPLLAEPDRPAPSRRGLRVELRGVVQGVGFRPFVHRLATSLGLDGRVRNDGRGVTVEVFGLEAKLDELVRRLRTDAPAAASIDALEARDVPAEDVRGFGIEPSREGDVRRVSIPPDLATCPECLAELRDPADRRHRYAFTNCTLCGPRYTIARGVPYDRAATTMAGFRMCPACEREYASVDDRRFHAQPNACPACGPRLALLDAEGRALDVADPIEAAAAALGEGRVVAVKGLGGFHLACDATSPEAVRRLRERKHREAKPLAVMVADLAAAEALAVLGDAERRLLASIERPIVLAPRAEGAALAPEIAPDGPTVGVLLAYTPLHHLLLDAAARPLVMTSGNRSDEPIATDDADAAHRLAGIADLFLVHDRAIEARADDSVARVIAGRPVVLRRGRGYVPRGIAVAPAFARPVLAVGAHLKNTFCLGAGDVATLGPHVGDLETLAACESLEAMIARMERFLGVRPELVACDLHPGYASTRYARARAAALGVEVAAVQHHHAHVASAMAEHGLEGPVLGLAWDGTGFGPDGAAWGGELLLATRAGYERLATFRPIALAGGEQAIREPWRVALALLDDAFDGDAPTDRVPVLAARAPAELRAVRRMIAAGVNAPRAHGVGRVFDAIGALVLGRGLSRYEGQVATALERAADRDERGCYPFVVDDSVRPAEVDLRPLVRAALADLFEGRGAGVVAARFHETLGAIAAALVDGATASRGELPVVLTGGCFQNARLVEAFLSRWGGARVVLHERVPPGDGGIALGQALVADAIARGEPPCA
jgi:hydrogenase maturation protein HypF